MPKKSKNVFLKLDRPVYKGKTEIIYEQIRKAIMDGSFKMGDRLETDQIAASLGVSRMPVRDAIKRLEIEGLAEVIPHKEVRVATITKDQIKDIFLVRSVLEGLVAREAAEKSTDEKTPELWALYEEAEQLVESGDTFGQIAKNREFHELIYELTGNKILQSIAANLFDSVELFRLQLLSLPRRPHEVLQDHRELVEAIASKNPDLAEKIMRQHIEISGQIMLGYARE